MSKPYVHGYQPRETDRLTDQAGTLIDLLHSDTSYPRGSTVLEAGCGVGATDAHHPLMGEAGLEAVRLPPDGLRGFQPARPGRRLHEEDLHVRDLHRTTEADGVFCYTFFKGVGTKLGLGRS